MAGTIAILLSLAYAAAAAMVAWRAHAVRARTPRRNATLPLVSVLIAARNEACTLGDCLGALNRQSYPDDRFEIIVADDHSEDATPEVAETGGAHCVRLKETGEGGKAAALHAAYGAACGDILLVTDADCRPPRDWIRHLAAQFDDPDAGLVCGVTTVRHDGLLSRIQSLDWGLLLTIAAGLSALKAPLTAMGNNMGIRREAYEAVGGYPALPGSVTEDFTLFRAVRRTTPWTVRLILDRSLTNRTEPLPRLGAVFAQRRRWARGGLQAGFRAQLFYLFVWSVHASVLIGLLIAPGAALIGLAVKAAADAGVLRTAALHIEMGSAGKAFPIFEAYLFGYVLLLPFSLLLAPHISWRGRRY
jgi:cellulose synthase/poly-beta-1,6-N-acetylglucosamine synthase-like glycosyltransferase